MGSFGERLQRERELRSITLDEIAASTKIGTRLLHALEAEEFDKLPGGIFNKGFVRSYARYLGLDEEQAVSDYLAAENELERERRAPLVPEAATKSQSQLFAIPGGARADNVYNIRANADLSQPQPDPAGGFLTAAVILVFALGLGGFAYKYFNSHSSPASAVAEPKAVTSVPSQSQPQPADAQLKPSESVSPPAPASGSATNAAKSSEPKPSEAAKSLPRDEVNPSSGDTASSTAPGKSSAPITSAPDADARAQETRQNAASADVPAEFALQLRADEDSWAQITADGKQLWSGVVSKDSVKNFRASKELVVRLGNAPGVQLSYNGKPLPRFSQDAKTRTLKFTTEGLSAR